MAAGTPALFAFNQSVGRISDEQVNRMHKVMLNPQMAFVSKQFTLVLPAQLARPRALPLLPRLDARLWVKADALCALAAALALATIMQLRKLSGLPSTIATMTKARVSAASSPAMMNRPRLARA